MTGSGLDQKEQASLFDKAMELFQQSEFASAARLFTKAAGGPVPEMSHSAQMRLRMCERRIASSQVAIKTPEDNYNYGVSLLNQRDLRNADQYLSLAVSANDQADHFHYALALCRGLLGDMEGAASHLKRAIDLAPENRVAARNDAEFQAIASHPKLREVLYPERSVTG